MSLTDNKVRDIPIYWEWKLETGEKIEDIDVNDIEDTKFMGRTMSMYIAVTGKQVLERPKYTVTFDANGGENLSENSREVDVEQELGELPILTRDGYTFDGWFTEIDGGYQVDKTTKMKFEDVTYYAHWVRYAKDVLKVNVEAATDEEKSSYVLYPAKDGSEEKKILCRVLYDADEANGGLQLVSVNPVRSVTLGDGDTNINVTGSGITKRMNSYMRAITTLNEYAEEYLDDAGIAYDARCIGSVPTDKNYPDNITDEEEKNAKMFIGMYPYNAEYSGKLWNTYESYNLDRLRLTQINALKITDNTYKYYYFASREVNESGVNTGFRLKMYGNSYGIGAIILILIKKDGSTPEYNPNHGLRPVFYLNSNAKIIGGEGTLDDPFELGI